LGARHVAALVAFVAAAGVVGVQGTSSANPSSAPNAKTCAQKTWTTAKYQRSSTPDALATLVLACLKVTFPATYRRDEVGLVSLNSYPWFQNVNEGGLTSTVQKDLQRLGMPPITLEDGPEGIITKTSPGPTALPNELALGATFDQSMASLYGTVLGSQAHRMGYDAVQAPDLNLVRVPSWGRAPESFGESPVLTGEMGGAEAAAIEAQHVFTVLKHFGPYSQETDRRALNQKVSDKALQEVYIRPFTLALRAVLPELKAGDHAIGIMCSYGNVNDLKACRSAALAGELNSVGVQALIRSDLDVKVNPTALLLNGVDLIKPMIASELSSALGEPQIRSALDQAVEAIFRTEFAAGLVNGKVTSAQGHPLARVMALFGHADALNIEQRAAVLLKNDGLLPLSHGSGRIAVIADATLSNTCTSLAGTLARVLATTSTCSTDARVPLPNTELFHGLPIAYGGASRTTRFTAHVFGPYVVTVTTLGNTSLKMDGTQIMNSQGLAEFNVQRTSLVGLAAGSTHTFTVTWRGAPPKVVITQEQAAVNTANRAVAGAKVAIVVAYDLSREGMDRDSLALPGAQNAIISSVAAKVPTIVVLATDGAVAMPWLNQVDGVLEVWNPTGSVQLDRVFAQYVDAWRNLLDGAVDPSGRLPITFPVSAAQSPMGDAAFWPGIHTVVDLNQAPYRGVGIGMAWYRQAGWPVLFPFGFGLSYTQYQLVSGSVFKGPGGLDMTVGVRDTGGAAGTEPVQVYANWPSSLGEPQRQLVGFGTVTFSKTDAKNRTVHHITITLSPDALAVWTGAAMHVTRGTYCLAAATFDGDPHGLTTGSVTLSPGAAADSVVIAGSVRMVSGACAG
jgi:beta-glucosidase